MSNFLQNLRKLNPTSFEDIYTLLDSIRVDTEKFKAIVNDPEMFAGYQVWLLKDASPADLTKFIQLFDSLELYRWADPSGAAFEFALSTSNMLQFASQSDNQRTVMLKSVVEEEERYKQIASEISKVRIKNNNDKDFSNLRQHQQLKNLISDIGDHGLELMADADPEQKVKGTTLMRLAITYRKQVDDYFKMPIAQRDPNAFKDLLTESAEYFTDPERAPVSLGKHHNWVKQAINTAINFVIGILFNTDKTYHVIQTASERKINHFAKALTSITGAEDNSKQASIRLSTRLSKSSE